VGTALAAFDRPASLSRHPRKPRNFCPTFRAADLSSRPTHRSIRLGSMQAIFADRTTDGAGNPARLRSVIATSHDQGVLAALEHFQV
jgi:hypothetical protein